MYNDGPYTPYGAKGTTVVFSGTIGGGNWGGVAFNPAARLRLRQHQQPRDDRPDGARSAEPREVPQRALLHAILGRQQVSVSAAALGRAGGGERQHRRHRLEDSARRVSRAHREGHSADRHAESRRPHRDGERRSSSSARPRTRASARSTRRPARSCGTRSSKPRVRPRR